VIGDAQNLGFLGPGPVDRQVDRALDLYGVLGGDVRLAVDLGSGGGLPGLPLAVANPAVQWILLDGSVTRCRWLTSAVSQLGLDDRVSVVAERAEVAGRSNLRGSADLVVARSFAAPAVTAECGAPFLRTGGRLVVAEPPGGQPGRWEVEGLETLGLALGPSVSEPTAYQVLQQTTPCPTRYPRRVGIPAKRPLF
jgi:16S rRNA (guanine527-N7)-methyltransferase